MHKSRSSFAGLKRLGLALTVGHQAQVFLCQLGISGAVLFCIMANSGCVGIATTAEEAARAEVAKVSEKFRPNNGAPELPRLSNTSGFADYLEFAMLNQPRVAAAYFDWLASVERITSARSLPDPQLIFQMDVKEIVSSVMPGLMQAFPASGKLGARADLAAAQSQTSYFNFQAAVLQSAFEVKQAYFELLLAAEQLRINRENLNLLRQLEELARVRNSVGSGTLQDVLLAQNERERLKTVVANLEDARAPLMAKFGAALGIKPELVPQQLPRYSDEAANSLSETDLLAAAVAQNLQLKSLQAQVESAEARLKLAKLAGLPDLSLGAMADVKMSPFMYRPVASISLPIWRDKLAAEIAEAQAGKSAAQARVSDAEIRLVADFAIRSYLFRALSRNLELLDKQLLPRVRQSFDIARAGYLSNELKFSDLAQAERSLFELELARASLTVRREVLLTELSLVINGLPMNSGEPDFFASAEMAPALRASGDSLRGAGM